MNVIPDREAPTMPKATMYHGDSLFPEKKVLLSLLPFVKLETKNSSKKYDNTTITINDSDMLIKYL